MMNASLVLAPKEKLHNIQEMLHAKKYSPVIDGKIAYQINPFNYVT
jgi:hypothetical protein